MSPWQQNLRPASWRGVPFGVDETGFRGGRDTALHEYPFRDEVWVEDVGRSTRKITLTGFLVGDDMAGLQQEMIDACEEAGPGDLVHPLLGLLQVTLVNFSAATRKDMGRVVELQFAFLQAGPQGNDLGATKPDSARDQGGDVLKGADALEKGSVSSFASSVGGGVTGAVAAVRQVQSTVSGYAAQATGLVRSAVNAIGAVSRVVPGLDRVMGRFTGGLTDPLRASSRLLSTVSGSLARLGQAKAAVGSLATRAISLAGRL